MTSHRRSESRAAEPEYGPFSESGSLDGVVILIGGAGDGVSVHLQDSDAVHACRASRALGARLTPYLFGAPVRVAGTGRWFRDLSGRWQLREFAIADFTPLREESLGEAVARLRAIPAAWKQMADPLALLAALRSGRPEP